MILKPMSLPPPHRRRRSIDRISSGSEDTVVLSISISEAMHLDCPKIDSTDESARSKSMIDFPNDLAISFGSSSRSNHVHFESSPRSARVTTSAKPSPRNTNPYTGQSPRSARAHTNIRPSPRSARSNVESSPKNNYVNTASNQNEAEYDSILPPIVPSCTNIIKESPFHSVVDESILDENTISSENSENRVNRTLTIVPNLDEDIETPEASKEVYHFNVSFHGFLFLPQYSSSGSNGCPFDETGKQNQEIGVREGSRYYSNDEFLS